MYRGAAGAGWEGREGVCGEAAGDWGGGEAGVPRGDVPARGSLSDDRQDRQQVRRHVEELLH